MERKAACKRVQGRGKARYDTEGPDAVRQVWLVEDGQVQRYDGYFQDYKEELVKEINAEMDED